MFCVLYDDCFRWEMQYKKIWISLLCWVSRYALQSCLLWVSRVGAHSVQGVLALRVYVEWKL